MKDAFLKVKPVNRIIRIIDIFLPARMCIWNIREIIQYEIAHLDSLIMVKCPGDPDFLTQKRRCVVLDPDNYEGKWYVGWLTYESACLSRIPFQGPIQRIVGPHDVQFFGIDEEGHQIRIKNIGMGTADEKKFKRLPLSQIV